MSRFKLHPLLLLAAAVLLPFFTSLFGTLPLIVSLQALGFLCLCWCGRPGRALKMLAVFLGAFALYQGLLFFSSIQVLSYISMFLFIFLRIFPSMTLVTLLLYDVETGELVAALNQIRLPKNLVLGFAVVVRFLPTVQEEIRTIRQALKLRRVKLSPAKPVQAMEYMLVPVLYRTQILSEELAATAVTKGAQSPARRTSLYDLRWHKADSLFTMILTATMLLGIVTGGTA